MFFENIGDVTAVVSEDYIVTLKGFVDSTSIKERALQIANSQSEVKGIKDEVFVLEPFNKRR